MASMILLEQFSGGTGLRRSTARATHKLSLITPIHYLRGYTLV
jgi:hypothetical protein